MVANVSMDKECELQARTLFCNFTFGACKDTQMVAIVSMECELPPRCSNTSLTTFDALQAMLYALSNFYNQCLVQNPNSSLGFLAHIIICAMLYV